MGSNNDELIRSNDLDHPANLIPSLCAKFWTLGWVTGTGGGASIRDEDLVYIAPSGVQKELMKPSDLYVLSLPQTLEKHKASSSSEGDGPIRPGSRVYLRSPPAFKPSQCTPLFLSAFTRRGARCCIHTHSPYAVLVTLILEQQGGGGGGGKEFSINNIEQIKGFARGYPHREVGNLGYHDTLRIPVIENTAHEEDLTEFMEEAMDRYPDAYAVLVRRHGVYVWGNSVEHAKTQCESLDYLFQLAVEMKKLGIPWISDIEPTLPTKSIKE
ncbi:Methylthioribulose-1-phosphate dehydratase [Cryphonectria parasitica EP155]|uniref:Methylthioribulose-1-phosphate dehydratase n=1 Tax=Cryphonectria parasitica (strain ATCC 38755 / EP155) TaxID=660469 RepID=A0A9P4Y8Y0_CRYP1|nr:Methylthioribulose-1-phosphate dehydratase [Cryphonectria parasitica EP155]KAF3768973.1 Methylthioribulose-1-phosphate dehydratase [Cryphonectria parasitica EP155]